MLQYGSNRESARNKKRLSRPKRIASGLVCHSPFPSKSWKFLLIILLQVVAPNVSGQNNVAPVPPLVSVDAGKPLREPLQYRFLGAKPNAKTKLELKGNGKDWRFVQFDKLPEGVKVRVDGTPAGYSDAEIILPSRWYWFKLKLPLVIEVEPSAHSPIEIAFWFGTPNKPTGAEFAKQMGPEQIREFTNNQEIKPDSEKQTVKFLWEAQGGPAIEKIADQSSPKPTESPTPTPPVSGIDQFLNDPMQILFSGKFWLVVGVLILLIFLFATEMGRRVRDFVAFPIRHFVLGTGKKKTGGTHAGEKEGVSRQGETIRTLQSDIQDLKKSIKEWNTDFNNKLDNKLGRGEGLTTADQNTIEGKINAVDRKVDEFIKVREGRATELAERLDAERSTLKGDVQRAIDAGDDLKNHIYRILEDLLQMDRGLRAKFEELQKVLNQSVVPESFYAKTLGAILGEHLEQLEGGDFNKVVGERLNQFFQTEVPRSEGIQQLRISAEAVRTAFQNVVREMSRLDGPAADEARQHLQRAEALVDDISGLQSQLQNRRVNIETTLRISVSTHPSARQTFLEELGRGIKRETDKLTDPEGFFARELERLITSDVVGLVDICDKNISQQSPELDSLLQELFEKSGLRTVVPREGETFRTSEHDLVQMVPGEPGKSLRVAQVISRGFYYKNRENDSLLRKAGVNVYR